MPKTDDGKSAIGRRRNTEVHDNISGKRHVIGNEGEEKKELKTVLMALSPPSQAL